VGERCDGFKGGAWMGPFVRSPSTLLALVLVAATAAGCLREAPVTPEDKFPDNPDAGTAFTANASGGQFAVHLDVQKAGRVAYRILVHDGARVDACLIPGHDVDLWWLNHTVPVKACQRAAILAKQGADLSPGPWTLALRASGCPKDSCNLTAVVLGAATLGTSQGPPDPARAEALDLARCVVC
jgi:hypothetical protein